MTEKNERKRLPSFLEHYRSIGVEEFFIVDNNSSDDSVAYLLGQEDVHVFWTDLKFSSTNTSNWANRLRRKYSLNRWGVVVDSDEFLIYPYYENYPLSWLGEQLAKERANVMYSLLLDMYSGKSIRDTHYNEGDNLLEILPYFDVDTCKQSNPRSRVVGRPINVTKVSFIKGSLKTMVTRGHHNFVKGKVSRTISGTVLHFKFTSDYLQHLKSAVKGKLYARKSYLKVKMSRRLSKEPDLSLYCDKSVLFEDSEQLLDLGLMKFERQDR